MTIKQLDLLNIGLMLLACIIAFIIPFELFLLAYAVLGPLHYLTEIGWLHKRSYFASGKYDFLWLIFLCLVLCSFFFIFTDVPQESNALCLFLAFVSGFAMILFDNVLYKLITIAIGFFVGVAIQDIPTFLILFAVLLPTIIHVFIFTGLFIIAGALKNKSVTGYLSVLVFVLCASSFFVFHPHFSFYHVSAYAKENLVATNFHFVNQYLMYLGGEKEPTLEKVMGSDWGFTIMRLIAFAYTYHYLNWFSKTSVIKWYEVPKKWLLGIVLVWAFSVGLYAYDYVTGLKALLFLSMLHVFLEFPLNFRSFQIIGSAIKGMVLADKPQA